MTSPLRLGSRRSALALAQSRTVAESIRALTGRVVELVEITTRGDVSAEPLATIGGTGVFVSALRDAVLAGEVDLAVHSYKDLPTAAAGGLVVAAVPAREDPRDALVAGEGRKLADLRPGATVGTGSPRRAAQLLAIRPDLDVRPVRGNVDTRIRLVSSGQFDAVVLAAAGMVRLGRLDEVTQTFDVDEMLPAPAQGAVAVECVPGTDLAAGLAALDDPPSRAAVEAERAVLAALEAGCSAPVGAYAETTDSEIFLRAAVVSTDGAVRIRMSTTGAVGDPRGLGANLAATMLADGAAALIRERHQ